MIDDKVAYFQLRIIQVPRVFRRVGKFISERREPRLRICRIAHPPVHLHLDSNVSRRSLRYDRRKLHVLK